MDKTSTIKLRTGNEIPVIGMGTWQLGSKTPELIDHALKIGYPMIDTSSDYGTQPGIGEGIRKNGCAREDFYLVTKVEETDDAMERTKSNLKELGLDYVDLTLIHRPPPGSAGEEIWEGLMLAKEQGLTRDIGVSNYSREQIEYLIEATGEVPTVNQIEWSPFGYSEKMLKYCQDNKIVIQAYSPLTRAKKLDNMLLSEIAEKYGKSPAQILLRWNIQLGTVPIPKSSHEDLLEENLDVFDFNIQDNDMKRLSGLNEHFSSLGGLPYITEDELFPQDRGYLTGF